MSDTRDLIGLRVGRLVVVERAANDPNRNRTRWLCHCDCGNERIVHDSTLRAGTQKSCGCYRKDRLTTHGMTNKKSSPQEYDAWRQMMGRCYNPADKRFSSYGARGIRVCARWHNPVAFVADMGRRPSSGHSLDRIDNDGNYEPLNCRWATRKEQMNNRRVSRRVTYKGQTKTVAEWAAALDIAPHLIRDRLNRGWTTERALGTPIKKKGHAPCSSS